MRRAPVIVLAALLAAALVAVPSAASDVEVVPLAAPTPDWYTPELHAQVLAAGAEGVPLPAEAQVPAAAIAFTGIRPGSWMVFPAWCTMNYVFNGGGSGNGNGKGQAKKGGGSGLGIGTAGHCTEVGDEVTLVMAPASSSTSGTR